ncbi:SGNH/GDSL hydrolase family protein [bacterium]|nr:SGNH/GDSL hydrolase family protein [bacterium]
MSFPKLTASQLEYVIQFMHPEKYLAWSAGVDDRVRAAVYGISLKRYRAIRARFAVRVRRAARQLLQDKAFARQVDQLPFARGAVVVGFGDSITDDHQSWLEILRELLAVRRPRDGIRLVNAGVSGDTSAQLISRCLEVVALAPDWIITMVGTNDTRLHGQSPTKCLVSVEETVRNLKMLRHVAATRTKARWVWMTPARVIERKITKFWSLGAFEMAWRNKDLDALARVLRRQREPVVDLQRVFGRPANPRLLMADGLHPNLAGQQAIVRALVAKLAA